MGKSYGNLLVRGGVGFVFASTLAFATAPATATPAYADASQASSYQGMLKEAVSATKDKDLDYVAYVTFNDNVTAKITFLEDGIFRYNVDTSGDFSAYATPRSKDHVAKIQAQPDTSDKYSHPEVTVNNDGSAVTVSAGKVTISFDKATAKMTVLVDGKTVFEESSALNITKSGTVQSTVKDDGEDFFGGGTQNGRFIHTGNTINIANESSWTDGGVSSPNPFYWSSDGYGVLRNTFAQGSYDFGATDAGTVTATHNDGELDAYYFVTGDANTAAAAAQDMLQDYFKVTGNPVLLPEYAFYVGHYNAYNRDMWSDEAKTGYSKWEIKGHKAADGSDGADTTRYEKGGTGTKMEANSLVETLTGEGPTEQTENIPEGVEFSEEFSAMGILDEYQDYDIPLGYFLPNDGYGAGYGQNGYNKTGGVDADGNSSEERLAAVAANVENLKSFADEAASKGVATGLWTQSNLSPDSNSATLWHTLRDFNAEVNAGVTTLKTDVAWVGAGYSFGLNGTKTAYDTVTTRDGDSGTRPNIVTLDGWAGSQRFAGTWTGDQTGGNWEYIRFHVPTFIGQSLSGNPNIGSDMDGIWGGNPIIATRDYQWKSFAPLMLDMDGWGSYAKMPYTYGDPYTGINRMYLKLKSSLLPYIYTTAASAANIDTGNGDTGLPFVRAILLSDDSDYAASTATQYEYTMGEDILVAPIYQNTDGTGGEIGDGDDVRNNIYLPGDENTIWIDYWTGEQYRGGQVLNNFDAPIWKLPVFVKANAIIPMYKPNDNPDDIDRTQRDVEFFATAGENSYTQFEDTGTYVQNEINEEDKEYGKESTISYGDHVSTTYTSSVSGDTATFTAEVSKGSYDGYKAERTTTFIANVSEKPTDIVAKNGDTQLKVTEAANQDEFEKAEPKAGEAVFFYNEAPNLNYNATAESEAVRNEEFSKTVIKTTPKLYVKFAKTDVSKTAQTLTLAGFKNDGNLPADGLNENLAVPADLTAPDDTKTPTSIGLTWSKVEGATSYELEVDGSLFAVGDVTSYTHTDLAYNSQHTYRVRARNADGYSNWSEVLTVTSLEDPWRNVPTPTNVDWTLGDSWGAIENAFDHDTATTFHSTNNDAVGHPMTIDYGSIYKLDKFVYTPRQDNGGNGNVISLKIETSVDGVHWTVQQEESNWAVGNTEEGKASKTVDLSGSMARYLRLTVNESNGSFFSAGELALYKVDGTNPIALGSITGGTSVAEADYQHLKGNCLGREDRDPLKQEFNTHVAKNGADFNLNGAYDVYDMAFTMAALDGGTTKTDKVSGGLALIPSKTEVKAGEIIDVDLYADDVAAVNALGALVHYNSNMFTYVDGSIAGSPYLAGMENLSVAQGGFDDGQQSVNLAFANRGDKDLYAGTGVVASFKLKAVADGPVNLSSTAWLVGPTFDFVETVNDGSAPELPEKPSSSTGEYGQDAFDITITNKALPNDDGGNVEDIIQGGKYDPLFDNVKYHDGGSGTGCFELKWATTTDEVSTPLDLHFKMKNPSPMDNVTIYNRQNESGAVSGNGYLKRVSATITFEDGSTQDCTSDETSVAKWVFAVNAENKGKKVSNVDVHVLETNGEHFMTISEIDFNYTIDAPVVDGVELGENATSLYVGQLSPVKATVMPENPEWPYYAVESSDESIASVTTVQSGDELVHYVRGNKPGKVTITVKSLLDETKTASYELEILDGVDTSALQDALALARQYSASAYTEDSYAKLTAAVKAAEELLKGDDYTANDVAAAATAITDAIKGLVMRPLDEATLINKDATSGVSLAAYSSQAAESPAENALDYNESTFWHSNYNDADVLPDYLIFDLGRDYDLTDVTFLPRQDGGTNGDIFEAKLYTANSVEELDGDGKGTLVGTFAFDNNGRVLTNRDQYQQMAFEATARYVKVEATKAGGDTKDAYASAAEFRFYGSEHKEAEVADKTELQKLVDTYKAEDLKAEDYTTDSWTKYANALADAERGLGIADATQAEVDGWAAALKTAHDGLVKTDIPPVENPEREQLQELVDKAKKVDTTGKTPESAQALKDAIAYAEGILADENATDAQLKDAYDRVKGAIEGLEDAKPVDPDPNPGDGSGTGGTGNGGSNNGGSGNGGSGNGGDKLAQTGDASFIATITAGLSGLVAAGAGIFTARKKRK